MAISPPSYSERVPVAIRAMDPDDVQALTPVMQAAFADDPVVHWVYRQGRARERGSGVFFSWLMRRLVGQGISSTTTGLGGAAIWALPGTWRESPGEALSLMATNAWNVSFWPRVLRGLAAVEHFHPATPHLYLALLGVDPALQGQGVGRSLLEPGLRLCDTDGLDAYLECTAARNVDYYAQHGFAVDRELRLPAGGPPIWLMSRKPGGGSAGLIA
jgi:predicted N-acetyltransferase YhbS